MPRSVQQAADPGEGDRAKVLRYGRRASIEVVDDTLNVIKGGGQRKVDRARPSLNKVRGQSTELFGPLVVISLFRSSHIGLERNLLRERTDESHAE